MPNATRSNGVVIATLLMSIVALSVAALGATPNETPTTRARTILTAATEACWFNCEFGGCDEDEHELISAVGTGNDDEISGEGAHGCQGGHTGCKDHSCGWEIDNNVALAELDEIVRSLAAAELMALSEQAPSVRINYDRGAVQVLGCNELLIMSVNLSEEQRVGLGVSPN